MSEHSLTSEENESVFEDLFDKDTESFKCLRQILVSRSSIFRHPLYPFPPLTDPGLDEVFYYEEPDEGIDKEGVKTYLKLCDKFKVSPFRRVIRSLCEDTLNLKYYGLEGKQIEALMSALSENVFVTNLILQDNWLSPRSVQHLSDMLCTNISLRTLNLKECRIQPEGADILKNGITKTLSLKELDLSYNGLDDAGLNNLTDGLADNKTIRVLNLSHNNLGEGSADALNEILSTNEIIEDLDLSWNNFYSGPGNTILFSGLMLNPTITKFKIAWNGIATKDATKPIMKYLKAAEDLQYFDISGNRLTAESFSNIRSGLSKCLNLEYLKIGNNLLKPEEAMAISRLMNNLKKLKDIHLENTFVTKDFLPMMRQAKRKAINLVVEGVLGNYVLPPVDQAILLFKRAKFLGMKAKSKKKRVDFGDGFSILYSQFVLSLPPEDLVPADFILKLKKFKLKLDQDLTDAIISAFPAPKGKVSCSNMAKAYLGYFPDTVLAPPKPDKKSKAAARQPQPELVTKEIEFQVNYSEEEEEDLEEEEYEEA